MRAMILRFWSSVRVAQKKTPAVGPETGCPAFELGVLPPASVLVRARYLGVYRVVGPRYRPGADRGR